jgi:hypothetical protein
MPETWIPMQLGKLLEIYLHKIKVATYTDHYVDSKIPKAIMFQCILDSEGKFCAMSVGFGTEILFVVRLRAKILFDICWIAHSNSALYLLDSAQNFCLMSVGCLAEIVFDACWIAHRNSVLYLLGSHRICVWFLLDAAQKLCSMSVGLRAEILFYICWIRTEFVFDVCWMPRRSSVRYLLDCAQKFYSVSVGFRTEFVFEVCWMPRRNPVLYLWDCLQIFYSMPAAFLIEIRLNIARIRTETVCRETSNVCRHSQCFSSDRCGTLTCGAARLGCKSWLQAICTCIPASGGRPSL